MDYETQISTSAEGLTKETALLALQEHENFKPGTKIANFYNQGGQWVAKLLVPKTAGNPFGDLDDGPSEKPEAPSHDEHDSDGPEVSVDIEDKGGDDKEEGDSKDKKIQAIEKKLDLLLDALGISEKGENPDGPGPDEGLPDGPPAPPKGGGGIPKSDPLPPGSGAKLKPGEVPNKPGMTPVGAPAFASVKEATLPALNQIGQQPEVAPATEAPLTQPGPEQPVSQDPATEAQRQRNQGIAGPVVSFTATLKDEGNTLTIKQAKASLENHYTDFHVDRIQRSGDDISAQLVARDAR